MNWQYIKFCRTRVIPSGRCLITYDVVERFHFPKETMRDNIVGNPEIFSFMDIDPLYHNLDC